MRGIRNPQLVCVAVLVCAISAVVAVPALGAKRLYSVSLNGSVSGQGTYEKTDQIDDGTCVGSQTDKKSGSIRADFKASTKTQSLSEIRPHMRFSNGSGSYTSSLTTTQHPSSPGDPYPDITCPSGTNSGGDSCVITRPQVFFDLLPAAGKFGFINRDETPEVFSRSSDEERDPGTCAAEGFVGGLVTFRVPTTVAAKKVKGLKVGRSASGSGTFTKDTSRNGFKASEDVSYKLRFKRIK